MKVYLYDVFHRCDSIADWTPDQCSLHLESAQKIEGQYSIRMQASATVNVHSYMRYDRALDWSQFKNIIFSVYNPGWTNETGMIKIHTDGGNWSAWNFDFAASWTEINIDLSSTPDFSAGTLDLANITWLVVVEMDDSAMGGPPYKDFYFDFFRGRSIDVTENITYIKITEEMGLPSSAELKIKGESLEHFNAGLEIEVYDKDDELSWRGRILYPEGVMEGTEVVGKIKALGSDSQFQNTYRKNYTTLRDSDYILKDVIDNALTKYHSYDDEIDNFTLTAKYDLKTKIQKTFLYLSMLERAVIGSIPGGEMFFNKYDNLSKGPQIYQGTYNFREDTVGSEPTGWTTNNGAGCTTTVIASLDGHKKVLQLYDNSNGGRCRITQTFTDGAQATGTIEIRVRGDDVTDTLIIFIKDAADNNNINIMISADKIQYYHGGGWNDATGGGLSDDTYYVFKIVFDITPDTYSFYLNEVLLDANIPFRENENVGLAKIYFGTHDIVTGFKYYISEMGYSWDANYAVGDNLKCWDESTSKIRITSYTPAANRHVTRAPVIGANNDLGQVYYVGEAADSVEQKYGINYLQTWRDPEITNYTEAKQLGDNLLAVYSLDTQMIAMLVVGKGHLQVGKTINVGWAGVFSITQGDFLLTKRVWYPILDVSELELTDNILTRKAFNVKVVNKFYDEDAQQSYDEPDVAESTVAGTVLSLASVAKLRTYFPIGIIRMFKGTWVDNKTIPGWYSCIAANAAHGVPDLEKAFVRGAATSGATGGSDDAVVVSHSHTTPVATGGAGSDGVTQTTYTVGTISTSSTGVSGVGKNIPTFYELIFIMRVS